jgi:hypothetical protein
MEYLPTKAAIGGVLDPGAADGVRGSSYRGRGSSGRGRRSSGRARVGGSSRREGGGARSGDGAAAAAVTSGPRRGKEDPLYREDIYSRVLPSTGTKNPLLPVGNTNRE